MVAEKIEFSVEKRETNGTGNARRMRKTGQVPAVIYGGGKEANLVQLNEHDFQMLLRRHASQYLLIDLAVGDAAPLTVLLKDVQVHPLTNNIIHVDFHEVAMDQKVKIEAVINFIGTPRGVTQGGGTADYHLRTILVECLPKDIVESFDLDISAMEVSEHMMVSDIPVDAEKYLVLTHEEVSVVSIAKARVAGGDAEGEEDEEEAPAAAEEGDEGEA
jgi:large subunit ribosomal protein L25